MEAAPLFAQLVFLRHKSIIYGSYKENVISFDRVPPDEPLQLICVGIKDGQTVACIMPLTASTEAINNLSFTPITPEQYKQTLEKLFDSNLPGPDDGISENRPVQPLI